MGVDLKLEVIILPVSDVGRAKAFYGDKLGWRLDADFVTPKGELVQYTPPGSPCSVQFGTGMTPAAPGSSKGTMLIVSDIESAREDLARRGVEISPVFHCETGGACRFRDEGRVTGPAPGHLSYSSFATFSDPDGNSWVLQEITQRLPGRVDPSTTTFSSASDVASALRRAAAAHDVHEKRLNQGRDENWPDWYAEFIVREQSGQQLPT